MDGKLKTFINKYNWLTSIFWIFITALITLFIERSCNKIMPESPILIKEITDTVQIVHIYDFNNTEDSIINVQLQRRLLNFELAQKYEAEILKQQTRSPYLNSIMTNALFPRLYIKASSRWQVGPTPLPSPTKKPLDSTEYGQMGRSEDRGLMTEAGRQAFDRVATAMIGSLSPK